MLAAGLTERGRQLHPDCQWRGRDATLAQANPSKEGLKGRVAAQGFKRGKALDEADIWIALVTCAFQKSQRLISFSHGGVERRGRH